MKSLYIAGIALLVAVSSFTSCKKTLDINTDPNNPTDVEPKYLLPVAQVQLTYTLGGDISRITGNLVQHYGGHRNQPLEYNQYDITPATSDGLWSALYSVVLRDLKAVIDKSRVTGDSMYIGVAQILSAHTFSALTDLYGDIPFSTALQDGNVISPAYDKQENIYPALITMIEAGIANVKSGKGVKPGTDDLVYKGVMANWERYGNSLKLRLLNHLSKKTPAAAAAFLNTNPLLITTNAQNAKVTYGEASNNANPIYGFDELSGRKDMAVSSTIVNKMKALADPRIPVFFNPVKNGTLAGQYLGNTPGNDDDDSGEGKYSRIGSAYASSTSPVMLMSAAEVYFIIAEVRLREGKNAEAATAYETAITRDFEYLGVSGAAAYLAKPEVAFNNTLQRLIEQKWITMFQAPYEAWTDWRRTGFPVLTPAAVNRTNNIIPRRLTYPQLEINLNRSSLEAGPGVPVPYESLKQRVWWDS
jgi:hypothetical protein